MKDLKPTLPDAMLPLYTHYANAQIDYSTHFLKMYIAYNAWYREVTGLTNDRHALTALKKRVIIWDDYCHGKTLKSLTPYIERLADFTQKEPFPSTKPYWSGEFDNSHDWKSLIEFWYQVRCLIVHGVEVNLKYAWIAYETLDIFMTEIVKRMKDCFTKNDLTKLEELSSLADQNPERADRFKQLQHKLYQKYIASPNIWQVDMQPVSETTL